MCFFGLACDAFKCEADDRCIRLNKVCDGNQDCSDKRDEINCGKILIILILNNNYSWTVIT